MADKILNRNPLPLNDDLAKEKLLQRTLGGQNSGVVYESEKVQVEYMQSDDIFMAEILSPEIDKVKAETNVWFRNQGLSQEAICNMPVIFYLRTDVADQLQQKNIIFNPLPNGC